MDCKRHLLITILLGLVAALCPQTSWSAGKISCAGVLANPTIQHWINNDLGRFAKIPPEFMDSSQPHLLREWFITELQDIVYRGAMRTDWNIMNGFPKAVLD